MAGQVYYLKKGNDKIYLFNIIPETKDVELTLKDLSDITQIKNVFKGLSELIIYSAIVQEDGRETDEIVSHSFPTFTKLSNISYNLDNQKYSVKMSELTEFEERISELEDAVNYMIFGEEV